VDVHILTAPFGDPLALHGFDILIANRERTRFPRELLTQLTGVRLIVQTGTHARHIDFDAARECGIEVAMASAGGSIGASELAIGLAIAVMRKIPANDAAVRRGEWSTPMTPVLHGKTLGLVGLGQVGRKVARIATAFGMHVLGWSPRLSDATAREAGAKCRELDDLLRESDVVSIHASLTPESRGLLDARRIGLMKPTAYLINTARGPIVDEAALIEALEGRRLAGAGLDVFDQEPLPPGHPLTKMANVVLQPHIGYPTDDGYRRFADAASRVIVDWLDGLPIPHFDHS
jgi:phosphoglycerate dehydrogenase-like enzyme